VEESKVSSIRLYREGEAAEALGVSRNYLRKKAEDGEIKFVWWGRERRYPHFYLEEWIREQLNKTDAQVDDILGKITGQIRDKSVTKSVGS
jgi:excisionase family DNA binding protein